jgi:hypothetical protein
VSGKLESALKGCMGYFLQSLGECLARVSVN